MTKLIEVCDVQYGYPFDSKQFSESDGMPLIRIRDVVRGYSETFTTEDYKPEYVVHQGDILIGMDGEFNIAKWGEIPALLNQRVCRIFPKETVDSDYIFHALPKALKEIENRTAFVTVKHLSAKEINRITIPIPPLEKQRQIAAILNTLQSIIAHRKQQLAKLDELVKARFVEMFGDPVSNNMKWDTQSVESVCSDIYGGGTPSKAHPEYYENGDIPWVSSKDMKTDIITESQIYINHLGVENSTAKMVPVNSVIMVIRSGILKHTLPVAINAVPITVNQDLKVFIPDDCILALFLSTLFKMLEKDILSGVRAVTADNIEFNSLKQRQIIVPPIELQTQFAAFVAQTDKSKVAVQKALDEAQLLFDSLMQEYFG